MPEHQSPNLSLPWVSWGPYFGLCRTAGAVLILVLMVLLAGCSDDVRPQPAELEAIEPEVELKRIWRQSIGKGHDERFLQLSPFIDANHVYAINYDGSLLNIGATTGLFHWQVNLGIPLVGGVGGDDRQLYVTSVDGELIALDRELGAERWRAALASEVLAPPVAYLGLVIVKTVNGKVAAYDANDGSRRWEYSATEPPLTLRGSSQPLVFREAVLVGMSDGSVAAISLQDGQLFWEESIATPKGKTELERLIDVDGNIVIDGSALFAVAYQGRLAKLTLFDGRPQWSVEVSSRTSPAVGSRNVFVAATNGDVVAFDKVSQQEVWRQSALAYRELTAPVSWGDYLLVGDLEGYVHMLAQSDGRFLARIRPSAEMIAVAPDIYEDRFIVLASDGKISAWGIPASEDIAQN